MRRYEHVTYGLGFVYREPEPQFFTKPNWFQRVILRRKPQPIPFFTEMGKTLGELARAEEERIMRSMFTDGR